MECVARHVHIIRSIPPCAHVHAALPQVLRVSPVKTWCDDGSYKLMNAIESMIHFMEISRVREQVLAEQMWTKYDQNICKVYLSKQGVERCDEVYTRKILVHADQRAGPTEARELGLLP